MKAYWDTSSLLVAVLRNQQPAGCTRPHTLAEAFSRLTGKGVALAGEEARKLMKADEAAQLLAGATENMSFVELSAEDVIAHLKTAQAKGVRGARVHDFLHACAAVAAGADVLYTLNTTDFEGLCSVPLAELPED